MCAETGSAGADGRTMCFPVQPHPFAAFSWISCHQQIVAALNPSAAAQLRADQFARATSRDACQDKRPVSGGKIARSDDRTAIAQTTDLLRINVYETSNRDACCVDGAESPPGNPSGAPQPNLT